MLLKVIQYAGVLLWSVCVFAMVYGLFGMWLGRFKKPAWQLPEVLLIDTFAEDKEWVLRHLELGGWKAPSPRDGIVPGSQSLHPIHLSDYDQTRPCPQCSGTGRDGRPTCRECRGTCFAKKSKAITSTPPTPLYRVRRGTTCRARPLAVHDEFCSHRSCSMVNGEPICNDCARPHVEAGTIGRY